MVISMIFHGCVSKNARDPESIIFLSGTRPGKRSHNYGKSPFLKNKNHSKWQFSSSQTVCLPEGICIPLISH